MRGRTWGPLRAVPLALAVALAACDGDLGTSPICPAVVTPAVRVVVTDSVTGQPPAQRARGWVVRGGVADSLRVAQTDQFGRVTELQGLGDAGEYTVVVEAVGYAPWAASRVRVRDAECGPRTVRLEARLRPVHRPF